MTPLARNIVKQLMLPIRDRSIDDQCGLLRIMDDIHCFDCTEVLQVALELKDQLRIKGIDNRSSFLPAPKTWIEFEQNGADLGFPQTGRFRAGYLLVEDASRTSAKVFCAQAFPGCAVSTQFWGDGASSIDLEYKPYTPEDFKELDDYRAAFSDEYSFDERQRVQWAKNSPICEEFILTILALINTPRVIGRRQHAPAKTLERKLVSSVGVTGSFPLHAWTEIKLEIGEAHDASGDGMHENHLTGRKALHFCRSHLRIKRGRVEVVRGHWRGDASIGIKQSRYTLAVQ